MVQMVEPPPYHTIAAKHTTLSKWPGCPMFVVVAATVFRFRGPRIVNPIRQHIRPMKSYSVSQKQPQTLFVWDFDWTIIQCNSDEYIPAAFLDSDVVHEGFRTLLQSGKDWHASVAAMVDRAMQEADATPAQIMDAARKMPYLTPIKDALDAIHAKDDASQIILSDGNTLFIGAFLEAQGLEDHFTRVVSNTGQWTTKSEEEEEPSTASPRLTVIHQSQEYGGHDCPWCPTNLCKTQALRRTLDDLFRDNHDEPHRSTPRLIYVGDGANDACPAINVLGPNDVLLARIGKKRTCANERHGRISDEEAGQDEGGVFGLVPTLRRRSEEPEKKVAKCKVLHWETGAELKALVDRLLDDTTAE